MKDARQTRTIFRVTIRTYGLDGRPIDTPVYVEAETGDRAETIAAQWWRKRYAAIPRAIDADLMITPPPAHARVLSGWRNES